LSEQEQGEILSALQGLSNIKTTETERVLQKLSTIFNKSMTNWLEVDYADWSHENDYFNDFKFAILKQYIAEFDYYNSHGDKTFRRIEPMQLWFKSKAWYLKGFCLTKQGVRLYKLSRIKNLIITNDNYDLRDSLDVSGKPNMDFFDNPQNPVVKLRIEPEMAYRVFDDFHESEIEKQQDGSFTVTTKCWEDNRLYCFILSFGRYVEVIEPEHIRIIIKEEAEKISGKYL